MKATMHVFLSSLRTHLGLTLARPTFQIVLVAQPIVMATIAYMIHRRSAMQTSSAAFIVLGAGLGGMWSSLVFSSVGDINRERFYGTLSTLLITPSSLMTIMLGKLAANSMLALISLAISGIYSFIVLGVTQQIAHPLAFMLALGLFLASTNMFALTLSTIFLLSRSTAIMQNVLEYPILIVTGIFFPLEILPAWARACGWLVPLTWSSRALYWTAQEQGDQAVYWTAQAIGVTLMLAYGLLAAVLFRVVERRVRFSATLDVY